MKKKIIGLLLLGCMTLGIMTGCSSNENKNGSTTQSNNSSTSSSNMTEEEKKKAQQDEIEEQKKYDLENKSSSDSSSSETSDKIVIKDEGFITDLDKIFDNVSAYEGKSITIEGFVRNVNGNNFSVLRYYDMPHEDHTDEVTVGINVTYDGEMPKDDEWVLVTGTIESEMYDGVKQPIIKASKVQKQFTWGKKKVTN
ncbi:hypothetical protein [Clostridium sp. SM-530-WT-3G]|uniref:TIGR03943 family putative permease subunit n=1 Tax=Clostridium sp. SM-530-WT-3G TaxID=2725303 RepID=UPI00145E84DE|nr:hypothetical protein [Clostridium sp. SM-530-WT-3G]NME83371.1 hypothetical protein [Clostridium sp. SM-530-WT-3G]